MYTVETGSPQRHRRRWPWIVLALFVLSIGAGLWLKQQLKPEQTVTQAAAVSTSVSYASNKPKHYDETNFGIDIPTSWVLQPRPPGTYQSFTWQSPDKNGASADVIQVFEDSLPVNYAANRALIVEGQGDHITMNGSASEKCNTFTKAAPNGSNVAVRAKWQDVDFLCDQSTTQRDSIATSSTDGVNMVTLKGVDGLKHNFLFVYTTYSTTPDYSVFYTALNSFKVQ